jgi:hypothetical protein
MTGYDYIEAVSDKQEVCNEINRLDRLRKILENRLEEEFKYS